MRSTLELHGVPDVLTSEEMAATGEYLKNLQRANGQIPWFEGGHCDPWNHVEVAMALTICGHLENARAAYPG